MLALVAIGFAQDLAEERFEAGNVPSYWSVPVTAGPSVEATRRA